MKMIMVQHLWMALGVSYVMVNSILNNLTVGELMRITRGKDANASLVSETINRYRDKILGKK